MIFGPYNSVLKKTYEVEIVDKENLHNDGRVILKRFQEIPTEDRDVNDVDFRISWQLEILHNHYSKDNTDIIEFKIVILKVEGNITYEDYVKIHDKNHDELQDILGGILNDNAEDKLIDDLQMKIETDDEWTLVCQNLDEVYLSNQLYVEHIEVNLADKKIGVYFK